MAPSPISRKARALFEEAIECDSPDARAAFVANACGGDTALLHRVQALIKANDAAESMLPNEPQPPGFLSGPVEQAGDTVGRYRLLEKIGEGGCGVVYMADQEEPVRRKVALKVIKPGMDTKSVIARFEAERQALAMMDHPNIAKVHDGGVTESGRPYFVMELVRGIRITQYCEEHRLAMRERLDLFTAVCSAVQHAHQKGIIHRDLKPSNILVSELDGRPVPKVIDFGIAKATEQKLTDKTLFTQFAQFVGTPAYMSPEQAAMTIADIDTRSDIYSLGVLLYELLTGTTPFDAQDLLHAGFDEMRRIIRETEPQKPSTRLTQTARAVPNAANSALRTPHSALPTDLDWIVMKCLEKDRARRYETAIGLAQDIQRHLSSEPVTARPASAAYRFRKMVRRNRIAFAAGGAVLAALVIGLGVSTWMFFSEKHARDKEKQALERAVAAEMAQSEERKIAEMEAGKSRQVAKFLRDMLKGVGPSVAQGDDTKMLRKILDKTADRVGADLKGQLEVEAELRTIIGKVYRDLGEYEKAVEMLSEALAITKKLRGDEHPDVAIVLNELGRAVGQQGALAEAEKLLREALAMERKLLGPDGDMTTALNNLATNLADQGKLAEAETMHRQALAMYQRLKGGEHEDVGISLNNLAAVLDEQGKPGEAETMLREALALQRTRLGEHPHVAATLNGLANAVRKQNKLTDAEPLYREVLALQRKLLGSEHPNVASALNGLGLSLLALGRGDEAEPLLREGVEIERKARKGPHPQTARLIGNLARVMEDRRHYPEAESLYREALGIYARLPGKEHPDLVTWRNRLYNLLHDQGKVAEMEIILREDLQAARMPASADASRLETCLSDLAKHLYRQGKFAEAEPLCRELLNKKKGRLGAEDVTVLRSMSFLGSVLADWAGAEHHSESGAAPRPETVQRAREAEGLLRECVAIKSRIPNMPDDCWITDEFRSLLGGTLVAVAVIDSMLTGEAQLAKFKEAEDLLIESAGALGQNGKVERKHHRAALARVIRLYEAWGQPVKASEWIERMATLDAAEEVTSKAEPADAVPPRQNK